LTKSFGRLRPRIICVNFQLRPLGFVLKNGKVVPDIRRHTNYYHEDIRRLNREINKYSKSSPPDMNGRLLAYILHKFLIYRLLGDKQNGWKDFRKDIRHYDNHFFFLNRAGPPVEKIAIDDIIAKMKKSLKEKYDSNYRAPINI
jgi:hypothetical protein